MKRLIQLVTALALVAMAGCATVPRGGSVEESYAVRDLRPTSPVDSGLRDYRLVLSDPGPF